MDRLSKQLRASSIPECIIASVILMVVFMITLETLSRLTVTGNRHDSAVTVFMALHDAYSRFADGKHPEGKYELECQGVTIEAVLEVYSAEIRKLTLTSLSPWGGRSVKWLYLIEKKYEE